MARLNDQGQITLYSIHTDEFEPITLERADQLENIEQSFGAWREATRNLSDLVLALAQGKVSWADFQQRTRLLDLREKDLS